MTPRTAADTRPRFAVVVERDVRVPTPEPDVSLSADVYRPDIAAPVPALVTVMPYRKDYIAGGTYDAPARWFAAHGFASAVVDLRGTGASDGRRRPEFDPGDGDDAVTTINWVAIQPWCDGRVGAWGMSYAANTTLRAASRRPPALQAIIAVAHALDAGQHSVHPDGARGDLHALVNRGTSMLLQQLLPPLVDHSSPEAQRRWTQRLHETEPALLDYARQGPDDPLWTDWTIDGSAIVVPTLCVGGWRDSFAAGMIETYERVAGPKRLLMGPWGHLLPQDSTHGPIDFLTLALQWWDEWLRDSPADPSPPVVLSRGDTQWRGYDAWPPRAATARYVADGNGFVAAAPATAPNQLSPVGSYTPDPTVGTLRGLPGLGLGESCPAQDQHDDDMRSVCATSEPLLDFLSVTGRPEVALVLDTAVARLTVRLAIVDPLGRSSMISSGLLRPDAQNDGWHIVLRPVHLVVPAGYRLRVAVADADFPRLTPLARPMPFTVLGLTLTLPIIVDDGVPVHLPPAAPSTPTSPPVTWTITRDRIDEAVAVSVATDTGDVTSRDGHRYRVRGTLSAEVRRASPEATHSEGAQIAEVRLQTGEHVIAEARVRCTQDDVWARGSVTVDGFPLVDRAWHANLQRE